MKRVYEKYKVILEPHGAVGWRGLENYLDRFGDFPLCISLETAHPAKFPENIIELLKLAPELPPSMKGIESRKGHAIELDADYIVFKEYLMKNLKAED
jgi:threonine synthase